MCTRQSVLRHQFYSEPNAPISSQCQKLKLREQAPDDSPPPVQFTEVGNEASAN